MRCRTWTLEGLLCALAARTLLDGIADIVVGGCQGGDRRLAV